MIFNRIVLFFTFILVTFISVPFTDSSVVFAESAEEIFGKIEAPTGTFGQTPARDVGTLIGVGIRTVFIVAGITCLVFMLWGGLAWITSGGEQEKLQKAQQRIRNAVVGMIVVVLMFGLFITIFGLVLGNKIIDVRNGFRFTIPSLDSINPDPGGQCPPNDPAC